MYKLEPCREDLKFMVHLVTYEYIHTHVYIAFSLPYFPLVAFSRQMSIRPFLYFSISPVAVRASLLGFTVELLIHLQTKQLISTTLPDVDVEPTRGVFAY